MLPSSSQARAHIGLGSNLAGPVEQVRAGVRALDALPATRLLRCSSLYLTKPVGLADQPDFVNAVCSIETGLEADELMHALLAIEASHGRRRGEEPAGGPRVLDLDLLLYGGEARNSALLTLPHPRLHERAFVLYPLAEIEPDLVIPGRGPVRALLQRCRHQGVQRLPEPAPLHEQSA